MNPLGEVRNIIVHHSGRKLDSPFLIKMRHIYLNRWEDVGYHYMIGSGFLCGNGALCLGRPEEYEGAHARGANRNSIGVCLVGNFDLREPSHSQIETLLSLLVSTVISYGLPPDSVIGHREMEGVTKTCPGMAVDMDLIRKEVARRL